MLDSQFEKIIKGTINYQSTNLGLNLLITRLKRKHEIDRSVDEVKSSVKEMNLFFDKYRKILTGDIESLKNM